MTPTKFLVGQITVVFAVAVGGMWIATQWAAWKLGYQGQLGPAWFDILRYPIYRPWNLFAWWYAYDAYAPSTFNEAGSIAALSGFAGCAVAIIGSLWRARQNRNVTTYGSSRWATTREIRKANRHSILGRTVRLDDVRYSARVSRSHDDVDESPFQVCRLKGGSSGDRNFFNAQAAGVLTRDHDDGYVGMPVDEFRLALPPFEGKVDAPLVERAGILRLVALFGV